MSNLVSLSGVDFVASQVVDMMEDCREMLDRLLTQCKAITSEHNSGMEVVSSKFKSTWKASVRAAPLGAARRKKKRLCGKRTPPSPRPLRQTRWRGQRIEDGRRGACRRNHCVRTGTSCAGYWRLSLCLREYDAILGGPRART